MGDFTYDEDGNPVPRIDECYEDRFSDYVDVTNPFVIKGDGFDVTLSLSRGMLSWTSVSAKGRETVQVGEVKVIVVGMWKVSIYDN